MSGFLRLLVSLASEQMWPTCSVCRAAVATASALFIGTLMWQHASSTSNQRPFCSIIFAEVNEWQTSHGGSQVYSATLSDLSLATLCPHTRLRRFSLEFTQDLIYVLHEVPYSNERCHQWKIQSILLHLLIHYGSVAASVWNRFSPPSGFLDSLPSIQASQKKSWKGKQSLQNNMLNVHSFSLKNPDFENKIKPVLQPLHVLCLTLLTVYNASS